MARSERSEDFRAIQFSPVLKWIARIKRAMTEME
jgi:hypothetical protein